MNQLELEANTCSLRQARVNACRQDTIRFGFGSDWLRKWREIVWPIIKGSDAKPNQLFNYFRRSIENCSKKYKLEKHNRKGNSLKGRQGNICFLRTHRVF